MKAVHGVNSPTVIKTSGQPLIVQQNITNVYQVQKSKREPIEMNCAKTEFQRTIRSSIYEAYILEKAREISREFSYLDFPQLNYDPFRRIVLRLRRKGKIMANPQRTIPRYYILAERLAEYQPRQRTIQ